MMTAAEASRGCPAELGPKLGWSSSEAAVGPSLEPGEYSSRVHLLLSAEFLSHI